MLKDFKSFLMRGNVVDLAIGVIIGAAFGKIVTSLVNDVMMPALGLVVGKMDFSNLFITLADGNYETLAAARAAGAPVIAYGTFLNVVVDFLIVAFCIFIAVRALSRLRRQEAETPAEVAAPTTSEKLLSEIRDLLAQNAKILEKSEGALPAGTTLRGAQTSATPQPTLPQ